MKNFSLFLKSLIILLLSVFTAQATTNTWTGAFNHFWHNAGNWSLGHIPTMTEDVVITTAGYSCYVDYYSEICNSITINSGADLTIYDQGILVVDYVTINGNLHMAHTSAELSVNGNITWGSGSTASMTASATIYAYKNWTFQSGANVQLNSGFVDFQGSTSAYIRTLDPDCSFNHIKNNKSGAFIYHSSYSTAPLDINGNLYCYSGSELRSSSSQPVYLQGFVNNLGGSIHMSLGTFVFDGASSSNNFVAGDYFNNLTINSSGTTTFNDDITVVNNLTINTGVLNPANNTIEIGGQWVNNVGPSAFAEGSSRVIFNGSADQSLATNEDFGILEINKTTGNLILDSNADITCSSFDWTLGLFIITDGTFTASNLADNGIQGDWELWNGSTVNLSNPTGYVDLLGNIKIYDGVLNVFGGIDDSYWPGDMNASMMVYNGTVDFKEAGIYVRPTGVLNEAFNNGYIKTTGNLRIDRSDFTPLYGTFQMYGENNAEVRIDNGWINTLEIYKTGTKENFIVEEIRSEGFSKGMTFPVKKPRDPEYKEGNKGELVTCNSGLNIRNLLITRGTFNSNGNSIYLAGYLSIYGNLEMTSVYDEIEAGTVRWYSGSGENITSGKIKVRDNWHFSNGTSATLGGNSEVWFISSNPSIIYCFDADASIRKIVLDKTDGAEVTTSFDYVSSEPLKTVLITIRNDDRFLLSDTVLFNNNITIEPGGKLELDAGGAAIGEAYSTLNINGVLYIDGGYGETNDLTIGSTGAVHMQDGEIFTDNSPVLQGTLNMSGGLFFSDAPLTIPAGFTDVISGGLIVARGGFNASMAATFQPTGGTVEVRNISDQQAAISCSMGNYFNSLEINLTNPLSYTSFNTDLTIKNDFTIANGIVYANNRTIQVGRDWINNAGEYYFNEGTSTVLLNGVNQGTIHNSETFYKLKIEKVLPAAGYVTVQDNNSINVQNNLEIMQGYLSLHNSTALTINGNLTIFNEYATGLKADYIDILITVKGNWINNNTTSQGFLPGYFSTVLFSGNTLQTITAADGAESFHNLVIDNNSNFVRSNDNLVIGGELSILDGIFEDNVAGLTHYLYGDILVESGASWLNVAMQNEVTLGGVQDQNITINNGTTYFWNLIVDKSGEKGQEKQANNVPGTPETSKNMQVHLINGNIIAENIEIREGAFNLNNNMLGSHNDFDVILYGELIAGPGSTIAGGEDRSVFVGPGCAIRLTGAPGNPATFRCISNYYSSTLVVSSGAAIGANHACFEDLFSNGILIQEGSMIDPQDNFSNCSFSGYNNPTSLLTIQNSQTLTIDNASFAENSYGATYNVTKDNNEGQVNFTNASGFFAGPAFENDPYNRVSWQGFYPGVWTGVYSTDWHDYRNWQDLSVPDNADNATINPGNPFDPEIINAPAECLNLTIQPGASLRIGAQTLNVQINGFIYGGLIMDHPSGALNIEDDDMTHGRLEWRSGSTANITAGRINLARYLLFESGSNVQIGTANTISFTGGTYGRISCQEPSARIGSLEIDMTAGHAYIYSSSEPVHVAGDMTVLPSNTFRINSHDLIVDGVLDVRPTASMTLGDSQGAGYLENNSDLTLDGELVVDFETTDGAGNKGWMPGEVRVHGHTIIGSAGMLTIPGGGSFISDAAFTTGNPDHISGTLTLADGLFEISNNSIVFDSGSNANISGGILRTGSGFSATTPGSFQPSGGSLEFTGALSNCILECSGGNHIYDLVINKSGNASVGLSADLTIMNDILITSGVLDATPLAIAHNIHISGNWSNYAGETGFNEGTGKVVFCGAENSGIQTDETFYNLEVNNPASAAYIPDVISGVDINILNDLNILDGTMRLNSNSSLTVGNDVTIANGAGLYAGNATNVDIHLCRNWNNSNVMYDDWTGFYPGLSLVTFGGSVSSVITASAPFETFNDVSIDKSGKSLMPGSNLEILGDLAIIDGNFSNYASGLSHKLHGDFHNAPTGSFFPQANLIFTGSGDQTWENLGSSLLYDVVIDKSVAESKTPTLTLLSYMNILNDHNLTVNSGNLLLNGNILICTGDVTINGGRIIVDENAKLTTGSGNSLTVNAGGTLAAIGTPGNEAIVSHHSGFYNVNIENGGTISAESAIFEYMKVHGVNVKAGAIVDPAHSFTNCTFKWSEQGGTLLTIDNSQSITADGVVFPANNWSGANNVTKTVNDGHVMFTNFSGDFSGEGFDNDPYNLIDWQGSGFQLDLKVFLEGPFQGPEMGTQLNAGGHLPLSQPYSASPWNYYGTESVTAIPNADIVDWVLVELRDTTIASTASSQTIIARQSAFLLKTAPSSLRMA